MHVFGFGIDTERDGHGATSSVAWGGSPSYEELRQDYKTVINQQLSDYEGMFKCVTLSVFIPLC